MNHLELIPRERECLGAKCLAPEYYGSLFLLGHRFSLKLVVKSSHLGTPYLPPPLPLQASLPPENKRSRLGRSHSWLYRRIPVLGGQFQFLEPQRCRNLQNWSQVMQDPERGGYPLEMWGLSTHYETWPEKSTWFISKYTKCWKAGCLPNCENSDISPGYLSVLSSDANTLPPTFNSAPTLRFKVDLPSVRTHQTSPPLVSCILSFALDSSL